VPFRPEAGGGGSNPATGARTRRPTADDPHRQNGLQEISTPGPPRSARQKSIGWVAQCQSPVQARVASVLVQQLLVRPLFEHPAVVEHDMRSALPEMVDRRCAIRIDYAPRAARSCVLDPVFGADVGPTTLPRRG